MAESQTIKSAAADEVVKQVSEAEAASAVASTLEIQTQIDKIASGKVRELLARRAELKEEIDRLSKIDAESQKMAMLEAEHAKVSAEIAKRGEDLASLSFSMASEMEKYGKWSADALKDSKEDIAARDATKDNVTKAEMGLAKTQEDLATAKLKKPEAEAAKKAADAEKKTAETEKWTAETELVNAKNSWKFWSRTRRIEDAETAIGIARAKVKKLETAINQAQRTIDEAQRTIDSAPDLITKFSADLEEAKSQVPVVEEQIQSDKRARLKEASLVEVYETITQWESQAVAVLKKDISEYNVRITETEKSLAQGRKDRLAAAERVRADNEAIAELEVKMSQLRDDQTDITDQLDPTYQRLSNEMADTAMRLDELNSDRMLAENNFSSAQIAVKEREASLKALRADVLLAKYQHNTFVVMGESAREIGQNLEVIIKGQTRAMSNESLERGRNKLTSVVMDVTKKVEVSNMKLLSDMAERGIELLADLENTIQTGDAVLATEATRYSAVIQKLKDGVKKFTAIPNIVELTGQIVDAQKKESGAKLF